MYLYTVHSHMSNVRKCAANGCGCCCSVHSRRTYASLFRAARFHVKLKALCERVRWMRRGQTLRERARKIRVGVCVFTKTNWNEFCCSFRCCLSYDDVDMSHNVTCNNNRILFSWKWYDEREATEYILPCTF